MAIERDYIQRVVGGAAVGKAAGTPARLVAGEFTNAAERLQEKVRPHQTYKPPEGIDFARLSKGAYGRNDQERYVEGYDIIPEFTSPDRVAYRHQASGHVILSFRGTDIHQWGKGSSIFSSRGFRDITSDLLLAAGAQDMGHRFYNAENVTKKVLDRYGKTNVSVTGHSLGGSQALHVSRKFGVHAEAYNPHISWSDAMTHTNYWNATIHVNKTDPVSAFYPWVKAEKTDVRYNKKAKPFLGQHGIDDFLLPLPAKKSTPTAKSKPTLSNPVLPPTVKSKPKMDGYVRYRPPSSSYKIVPHQQTQSANPVTAPKPKSNHSCRSLPLWAQIQNGCAVPPPGQAYSIRARA